MNKSETHDDDKKKENPKKDLENMVKMYLASNPTVIKDRKSNELELRFGTNPRVSRPISKIDYENAVKQFYSHGFTTSNATGLHILRIQNEYIDPRSGATKISNIRGEMVGIDLIQEYCKSNNLQKILDMPSFRNHKVKFTKKMPPLVNDTTPLRAVDFPDFNFRVSYQIEQDFTPASGIAKNIISKWTDSKKLFRYINRVRFAHPTYPLFADISIIKGNKRTGKVPVPQYTIQDAGVFDNIETYEIELEIDNQRVGSGTPYNTSESLLDVIRKGTRIVLGALQGTNYPVSYHERDTVAQEYMKLLLGESSEEYRHGQGDLHPTTNLVDDRRSSDKFGRITPSNFIGPSSLTLQMENIIENGDGLSIPNIRKNYTVTDKADGDRKMLYISDNGRIYMIDTNMNVIFTGAMTAEKTLHNSLLDGEHIKYDKHGKFINLYAAFDIYYINKKSVRELAFMKTPGEDDELDNKYRLLLLMKSMKLMKPYSILDTAMKKTEETNVGGGSDASRSCDFTIKNKTFYTYSEDFTIFDGCSKILSDIKDGIYEYNTDGLIFTPCDAGVGSHRVGSAGKLTKKTWNMSFKWKPPQFNTIDFLVSVKKDKNGKDEIHNIFQEGKNITGVQSVVQYKTLVLRCGFSENEHGFLNPAQNMIDNILPSPEDGNTETYKPVPFQPTNPYDPMACFCNILLHKNDAGDLTMKTEEEGQGKGESGEGGEGGGEYFEEDMIVEFRYDMTLERGWKWIPIRVRYDKTAELRSGRRNYGNAYHVANNNWHSIHHPITEEMISTGQNIPELVGDDDVYYNRYGKESNTKMLRNFHNLYVKMKLIRGVSDRKQTLIDFAVGKAGDLSKWRESKLGFVFGVDVSKDNINNNLDGACARYLKERKTYHNMPTALFVNGNSAFNIRNGKAFPTEKDKMIAKAVFGNGPKDRKILGEGVYAHYGIAQDGFNVSSCQFALHYFFENQSAFHSFISNVAECTCMGGYFIGTCYDGKTVFNLLKKKMHGESMVIMKDDKKIYEITKMYHETGFPDDEASLGYPIDVFQETINKVFREYLVNFDYFVQIMEDYGFVLVSKDDAKKMGLPNGTGLFKELFVSMENEVKRNPIKAKDYGHSVNMSDEERRISFMNRYFIFKKMRTVNTDKMAKVIANYEDAMNNAEEDLDDHRDAMRISNRIEKSVDRKEDAVEGITKENAEAPKKPATRKIKKKMVINQYSPIIENPTITNAELQPPLPPPPPAALPSDVITFKKHKK